MSNLLILLPFGSFDFNWALALRHFRAVQHIRYESFVTKMPQGIHEHNPENYNNNVNSKRGAEVAPSAPLKLWTRLGCQPISSYHQSGARKEGYGQNR